jgi:hypothetical protein
MTSLRERQVHMTQLIKKLDRMIVEKHGKFNLPFYHYQKPLAAPGERDTVCVYIDSVRREYLPFGIELEKMLEDARLWVRTGEGPRPEVMINVDQEISLAPEVEKPKTIAKPSLKEEEVASEESENPRDRRVGARRKIFSMRSETEAIVPKNRARPPTAQIDK